MCGIIIFWSKKSEKCDEVKNNHSPPKNGMKVVKSTENGFIYWCKLFIQVGIGSNWNSTNSVQFNSKRARS